MLIGYVKNIDQDTLLSFRTEHGKWTSDLWSEYFYHHQNDIPLHGAHRIFDAVGSDYDKFIALCAHTEAEGQQPQGEAVRECNSVSFQQSWFFFLSFLGQSTHFVQRALLVLIFLFWYNRSRNGGMVWQNRSLRKKLWQHP